MKRISRRLFLERAGTGLVAGKLVARAEPGLSRGRSSSPPTSSNSKLCLRVNGKDYPVEVEDHWTVAEVLRDHLRLTGTKIGCNRGECGACTVLLDGRPVYSCSTLAVWVDGKEITTVEGLARGGRLDPLQKAFIEHDAPQCGFCTSGHLMAAKALTEQNPNPGLEEVRRALSGNLCRCSNYNQYVEAVLAATGKM